MPHYPCLARTRLLPAAVCFALLAGCGQKPDSAPTGAPVAPSTAAPSPAMAPLFVDASASAGLDFVHFNAVSGGLYMPEMMGSGAGLIDYDNDGMLDLYLVQGAMLGANKTPDDAATPPVHPLPLSDRLYRSIPTPDGSLKLLDVTAQSGLDGPADAQPGRLPVQRR